MLICLQKDLEAAKIPFPLYNGISCLLKKCPPHFFSGFVITIYILKKFCRPKYLISDDLTKNGRQPHQKWKRAKMEDNKNGRRPKLKITKMEDDQTGEDQNFRSPNWKMSLPPRLVKGFLP